MESRVTMAEPPNKRPRSPSGDQHQQSKIPKTHSNHLHINYLARQYPDNLPLVAAEDTMPAIMHLISEYDGVLQRHESIAGNLGACPLGPILIKRFERLFDGPPRVLKSHGKDGPAVTWLDVVEFAKSKPEQFNLEKSRHGMRVCQFYTKQSRVEISEEDFVLIASGMPQKMIPPQPIIEDEEKELGALEILEKNLQHIIQMADQVSARARQLSYRLKNRRTAIMSRRENDVSLHSRTTGDTWRPTNGHVPSNGHPTQAQPSGFLAINTTRPEEATEDKPLPAPFMFSHSNTDNVTIINGTSIKGASPDTRADLMKKFFTTADRQARGFDGASEPYILQPGPRPRGSDPADYSIYNTANSTPVAIPSTPSSLLPPPKSAPQEKDDGGPFKLEMVARMEDLQRGERVVPPCDRCRRLHMDCLKNLTACLGCTKKHAKCSWRDVKEKELHAAFGSSAPRERRERTEDDRGITVPPQSFSPANHPSPIEPRVDAPGGADQQPSYYHSRHESAPSSSHYASITPGIPSGLSPSHRAASEADGARMNEHTERHTEIEDPGANQRLMQAILDTVDHHARVAAAVQEKARSAEQGPEPPERADGISHKRDSEPDHEHERHERNRALIIDQDQESGDREQDREKDRERRLVSA